MLRRFLILFWNHSLKFTICASIKINAGYRWLCAAPLPTPARAVACLSILGFTSAFHLSRLWLCMTLWHRGEYRCLSLCLVSGCLPAVLVPVAQFRAGLRVQIAEMLKREEGSQAYVYGWGRRVLDLAEARYAPPARAAHASRWPAGATAVQPPLLSTLSPR